MIEAATPSEVGTLHLLDFCEGGTLDYVRDFERFLLPPHNQFLGKTPVVMVAPENWAEVCLALVRKGVCGLLGGRTYIVSALRPNGEPFEICRLIMNLVPTNGLCRNLVGDTSTLPTIVGLSATGLEDHQVLLTSSEDARCFCYLFLTPSTWWPYMGFGRGIPEEGLPAGYTGRGWHLHARVVAIAQHVHRRVVNRALRIEGPLASSQQEIRRDRPSSRADRLYACTSTTSMS